jgi:HAD superfamily hydrolase (TIGR01548 family)
MMQKTDGILDKTVDVARIDSIIFDCDGVLVDVSKSYDLAIIKTTKFVLEKFAGIAPIDVTPQMIDELKNTGGFNDEVDVTYALILAICAENDQSRVFEIIKNADRSGIASVEKYLSSNENVLRMKKILDYPGPHATNPLYVVFDQMFYGPELYQKIFGKKSEFSEKGLIENDVVLLDDNLISFLKKRFGKKMAIVTGRGLDSIRYSLGKMLDEFDVASSAFLEDEPRSMAKPNPESLVRTIENIGSRHCLYVGDSMEDLIMAKEATALGKKTTFCGIYGTGKDPQKKRTFFEQNGADMILESIGLLPKVL